MVGPGTQESGSARSPQALRSREALIDDVHRHHRRRALRRAVQVTALAGVLLLVGVIVGLVAERRARSQMLLRAQQHLLLGTSAELSVATQILAGGLRDAPDDAQLAELLALARGHAWLEFGQGEPSARAALLAVGPGPAQTVATAMLAFSDGEMAAATSALASVGPREDTPAWVQREALWLGGVVAVAAESVAVADLGATDPVGEARDRVAAWVVAHASDIALRRILAHLQLHTGQTEAALQTLAAAREDSVLHMGLAADDALYHAVLRTKLAAVASVADQLLEPGIVGLSPADRARVVLARAVVHAQSGERAQALARLDEAWEELEPWSTLDRRLAIETALEAGDATRVVRWVEQSGLSATENEILAAWGVLLSGDTMAALSALAGLDQTHARVGYLQALALVEQGRWSEAGPWLARTEAVLPGRVEIEVARARVELRTGNPETALNKLRALAEFEPYAPRAWTGLGEAHLAQATPDRAQAKRALQRAAERESVPAEATLLLAQIAREDHDEMAALRLHRRAAELNPRLPKYGEALALYLAELGLLRRAEVALGKELDRPGVGMSVPLALAEVLRRGWEPDLDNVDALIDEAQARGATEGRLAVARARVLIQRGGRDALVVAVELARGQIARAPTDVAARALLVRALLAQRDKLGAEAALRRGLQACPDGTKGRLIFEWARMDSRTGKRRVAAPRSRRAWVDMLAEPRGAWELLDAADLSIGLWLRAANDRVALSIAAQLTTRLHYHSAAWTLRAQTELAAGETRSARTSADKAVALDPENPAAHEVLGHSLLRFGRREGARRAYERALALVEGTSRAAAFRDNLTRVGDNGAGRSGR